MQDWSLIVLAAGKGTRLGGPTPKPLVLLAGQPLIAPIIKLGLALPFAERVIVISEYTAGVAETFPDPRLTYLKTEPRGTGFCALAGLNQLQSPYVLIAQADDSYFYSPETLRGMCEAHAASQAVLTIGVTTVPAGSSYTGIHTDQAGHFIGFDKAVAATERPAVCGLYAASTAWLKRQLALVEPDPQNGEIGLPWVAEVPRPESEIITSYNIPSQEWQGVNTPAELAAAQILASGLA